MHSELENTTHHEFFAPLYQALNSSLSTRNCPEYSDESHVISSVSRVIENVESGREWTQQAVTQLGRDAGVGEFLMHLRVRAAQKW